MYRSRPRVHELRSKLPDRIFGDDAAIRKLIVYHVCVIRWMSTPNNRFAMVLVGALVHGSANAQGVDESADCRVYQVRSGDPGLLAIAHQERAHGHPDDEAMLANLKQRNQYLLRDSRGLEYIEVGDTLQLGGAGCPQGQAGVRRGEAQSPAGVPRSKRGTGDPDDSGGLCCAICCLGTIAAAVLTVFIGLADLLRTPATRNNNRLARRIAMPDTTQSPAAWEAVKGLVEMLTGHSARIAVLETENGRLRDRVDDLQSRVAMLEQCRAPTPDELERLRMVSKLVEVLVGEFARDAGAAAARQVVPRTDDLVVVAEAILRGTSADAKYAKALHELHKDMSQGQSR